MIILEMSVSASLLILAITLLRVLLIHRVPKMTFLLLWGIAVCRLFIPFSIISPFSATSSNTSLNGFPAGLSANLKNAAPLGSSMQSSATTAATNAVVHLPIVLALIVWAAGAMVVGLLFLVPHLRYIKQYRAALPVENLFVRAWLKAFKTMRHIRIRVYDQISAPFTYGILRPVILLPKNMEWKNEKQLRYVLAHEIVHIRRMDILWKWILAAAVCIHWFNPLVWVMYVVANRDIELACDEAVVRQFSPTQRSSYARTLVRMEETRSLQAVLVNHFSKNAIKERIDAIMKLKKITFIGIIVAVALVTVAITLFATTGPVGLHFSSAGGNVREATPVMQNQAALVGVSTVEGWHVMNAEPVAANVISPDEIAALLANAKPISTIKDLVTATSPSEESKAGPNNSIILQFSQDMDPSTLDYATIIVYEEKNSSIVDYMYNINIDSTARTIRLDIKPDFVQKWTLFSKQPIKNGIGYGNVVHVFLTGQMRTANGKSIGGDIVLTYRT